MGIVAPLQAAVELTFLPTYLVPYNYATFKDHV